MEYKDYFKRESVLGKIKNPPKDLSVDPKELRAGESDELEHTEDPKLASIISKHHLKDDPHYYSKLKGAGLEQDECATCGCGDPTNDHSDEDVGDEYDDFNGGLPKLGGALSIPHLGDPIRMSKIISVGPIGKGPANGEVSGYTNVGGAGSSRGVVKDRGGLEITPDGEPITAGGKKVDGGIATKTVGGSVTPGEGQKQGGKNTIGTIAGTSKLDEGKQKVRKIVKEVLKEITFDKKSGKWVRLNEGGHKAGCTCGFCKNKGTFGKKKDKEEDKATDKKDEKEMDEMVDMKMGPSYKTVQARQYKVVDDDFARTNQYEPEITERYDEEEESKLQEQYVYLLTKKSILTENEMIQLKKLKGQLERMNEKKELPVAPTPTIPAPGVPATAPVATAPAAPAAAVPPVAPPVATPPVAEGQSGAKPTKKKGSSDKSGATSGNSDVRSPTSTSTDVRSPTSTKTSTDAYTAGNVTVTGGAGSGDTEVHITQVPDNTSDAIKGRNITPQMKRAEMAIDNEGDPSSMKASLGKDAGGDSSMKADLGKESPSSMDAKLGKSDASLAKTNKQKISEFTNIKMGPAYKTVQPRMYDVQSDDRARANQYDPQITEMYDEEEECMAEQRYTELINVQRNLNETEITEMNGLREKIDKMQVAKRNYGLSQGGVEPNVFEGELSTDGNSKGFKPMGRSKPTEKYAEPGAKEFYKNWDSLPVPPKGVYPKFRSGGGSMEENSVNMKMGPSYKTVQPRMYKTAEDDFARTNQYEPEMSEEEVRKGGEPSGDMKLTEEEIQALMKEEPVEEAGIGAVQHSSYRTIDHGNIPQDGKTRWADDLDEVTKKVSKAVKTIQKGQKGKTTKKNPKLKFQPTKHTTSGVHKRKT